MFCWRKMIAKFYLILLVIFPLISCPYPIRQQQSSGVAIFAKVPGFNAKGRPRNGIMAVADLMDVQFSSDLLELRDHVEHDFALSPLDRANRVREMATKIGIADHGDIAKRKIQMLQSGDGRRKFAIGFVGDPKHKEKFMAAEKAGINSMEDLGQLLDKIHHETNRDYAIQLNDMTLKSAPNKYLVSDGRKIYSIKVGRMTKEHYMPGKVGGRKPPKIKELNGPVHAQGWNEEFLNANLKRSFGHKLFGKHPTKMPAEEAHEKVSAALGRNSAIIGTRGPGLTSNAYIGWKINEDGSSWEVGRTYPEEARHLNRLQRNEMRPSEIVQNFAAKGWLPENREWKNSNLREWATEAHKNPSKGNQLTDFEQKFISGQLGRLSIPAVPNNGRALQMGNSHHHGGEASTSKMGRRRSPSRESWHSAKSRSRSRGRGGNSFNFGRMSPKAIGRSGETRGNG